MIEAIQRLVYHTKISSHRTTGFESRKAPSTQVSVERKFLHLRLVVCESRVRMGNDLIKAIVFLRIN